MRLTVVGCSGSVSGPESPASSYLVQAPYAGGTFSLVLDLGPGAFGALYRYLDPAQVDAFALSHLHPDHCLDLCGYYVAAAYSPTAPWPRRLLFGPTDTPERLVRAYEVRRNNGTPAEPGPGIGDHFDYRTWQPQQKIGPFLVETALVDHPVEAYAMRITEDVPDGGTLVYSGDTGPCDALTELARGADLLLVEAASLERPANPPGLHLTGRQAAEVGEKAGVSAVVLTHIPPWSDPDQVLAEALPHFGGPLSRAVPGASWEIGWQA
jgi:ribonuclease BN (tRNA processing enzyme)